MASPPPILTIIAPGAAAYERTLDRSPFVVGRDAACDLVLDYGFLSRRHLVFEEGAVGWSVRSEGRNEVTLRGAPLVGARIVDEGDRLEMGPLVVVFDGARVPAPSTSPPGGVTIVLPVSDVMDAGAGSSGSSGSSGSRRQLVLLCAASGRLSGGQDPDDVARVAEGVVTDAIDARSAAIVEPDSVPGHVSRQLVEDALARGATLTVDDANATLSPSASIVANRIGPAIVSPLGAPSRGVLYVDRVAGAAPFSSEDAAFVTVLAQLAGAALASARNKADLVRSRDRIDAQRKELNRDIERRGRFGELIGSSAPMKILASKIAKVAPTDATVLIHGETGAGKELVAREVHHRSARADASFFALNCAALPDTLVESELFGHKQGAFSGADRDRKGLFELAAGGTVFLDEIGELPAAAQAKVLRAIDAKEILPLGEARPLKIDVRLVAATHRDLQVEVAEGRFRQDLYFRLNVFPMTLPPLRDRLDDVPALVDHFVASSTIAKQRRLQPATRDAIDALMTYSFPGNVRELAHIVERAAIMADDGEALDVSHLPDEVAAVPSAGTPPATGSRVASLRQAVADFERALILRELERDGFNRTQCAKRLKVSLRAFMDKLKKYDIREEPR